MRKYNVYYVCTCIVKVVNDYDLSVLSMSVMGFKKSLDWVERHPSLFWIL